MRRVGNDDATGGLESVASHDGILVVLGDRLADQPEDFGAGAALYVYLGTHDTAAATHADYVLPVTTHAEGEGTLTNHEGRVQRFWPALRAPGMARPAWLVVGALVAERSGGAVSRAASEAFASLGPSAPAFGGITYDDIGARGAVINESVSLTGD
jgi:NADH-quinone oxidoreductase subunit G